MSNQPETDQEHDILLAALDLPEEKRDGYLLEACGGNVELKERLCKMLRVAQMEGSFMAKPMFELAQTTREREIDSTGKMIGPYKLLQIIGEGGMGTVYMAEQSKPVERRVALKIIKAGMDTKQVIGRFEAERQALAIMDHPNIAKVLDAGTTNSGHPYFVMELVKGVPITKYCDEKKLNLRQRLELMIPVCQAIQHAHQKGIIHRDIKPSNVLVAQYDGRPVPKVIDFGVAKATAQKLTEKTMFTEFGQVIGTLEYMSPEQAELNQLDIDTRSDVYSLGVLLYELLAGSTPLDGKKLRSAAFGEMLRMIREDEPQRPSNRLSTIETLASVAANRQLEPGKLSGLMRGELDWIVMMALEKDRNRRYETANGMAMDIQRYLLDEPVLACPPSSGYRLKKFARRNKVLLSTGAIVAASMCAGLACTSWQAFRATRAESSAIVERDKKDAALRAALASEQSESEQKRKAELAKSEARQQEQTAKDQLAISNAVTEFLQKDLLGQAGSNAQAKCDFIPDPNITIRKALDRASANVGDRFSDRPELEAKIRFTIGNSYKELGLYAEAIDQLKQCDAIKSSILGTEHPDTLATLSDLARAQFLGGRFSESIELYEKLRDIRIKLLGSEHQDTFRVLSDLAVVFEHAGRTSLAIEILESVFDAQVRLNGLEQEYTRETAFALAAAYHSAGKTSLAIKINEQQCELSLKIKGPEHEDTLIGLGNLAQAYQDDGRTSEAIKTLEKVREALVRIFGPEHPNTLNTASSLAHSYHQAGRTSEATKILEQVRESQIRTLGPEHLQTLMSGTSLASFYNFVGDVSEAIKIQEPVNEALVRTLGHEHPTTLTSFGNLSVFYGEVGRRPEALKILEEIVEVITRTLGPDHPSTLIASTNLAVHYGEDGKASEAIKILEQVRETQNKIRAPEHPASLRTVVCLAQAYRLADRLSDAIKMFEQVRESQVRTLGGEHPSTLDTSSFLGEAYLKANRLLEAIVILEQAREARVRIQGLDHPGTLYTLRNLAGVYLASKRFDDSIQIYEDLLKHQEAKLGRQDPGTLRAIAKLGAGYMQAGRLQDAIPLFEEVYFATRKMKPISTDGDNLLAAYEKAGMSDEIANLVPEFLASARAALPKDRPKFAKSLDNCGRVLLTMKIWQEAELLFRESLSYREQTQVDDWTTYNTSSTLGGSLLGQEKFAEAEPLLLAGYEGMKLREDKISTDNRIRVNEAIERLIELYTALQKPEQAEEWRKKLDEWVTLVEPKSVDVNVPPK